MDKNIAEHKRILKVYEARELRAKPRFFEYENLVHMCRIQERHREALRILADAGYHKLSDLRILDVGCGDGSMLRQFLEWGASPENLTGIELRQKPVDTARHLNPNLDVRCGSAAALPWPDGKFDLVCQHTVFTSILDSAMKQQVAAEMVRVLREGGAVLWYDFFYDNPGNPDVRGVDAKEIQALFPGLKVRLRRITLAPPIARRIPERYLPVLYPLLSAITPLRTHNLGLLIKS